MTTFLGWPVEPVTNGKISDFIFLPPNGLTGKELNLFEVGLKIMLSTASFL
jgi:hypothetical protein